MSGEYSTSSVYSEAEKTCSILVLSDINMAWRNLNIYVLDMIKHLVVIRYIPVSYYTECLYSMQTF